ncbi:hypothetical protein P8452_65658 [Trifolium repens]|nr:hypothetical protein P8452_65658 [Trifolium repens]
MQGEKHLKEFSLALVEIGEGRGVEVRVCTLKSSFEDVLDSNTTYKSISESEMQKNISGNDVSLSQYSGMVLLIVNIASH